jgi:hypothetical protein
MSLQRYSGILIIGGLNDFQLDMLDMVMNSRIVSCLLCGCSTVYTTTAEMQIWYWYPIPFNS